MDKYQQLNELLQDEAKAKEIFTESIEETQANLKQAGLEFSIEELDAIAESVAAPAAAGELDAEDLDNVSGGVVITATAVAIGVAIGGIGLTIASWKKRKR